MLVFLIFRSSALFRSFEVISLLLIERQFEVRARIRELQASTAGLAADSKLFAFRRAIGCESSAALSILVPEGEEPRPEYLKDHWPGQPAPHRRGYLWAQFRL